MFSNLLVLSPIISFIALITIIFYHNQLLIVLLNLEIIILGILITLYYNNIFSLSLEPIIILSLLTIAACAAAIGLRLLVKITRSYGNDNILSLNIIKC